LIWLLKVGSSLLGSLSDECLILRTITKGRGQSCLFGLRSAELWNLWINLIRHPHLAIAATIQSNVR
jgi:hypothetical protein